MRFPSLLQTQRKPTLAFTIVEMMVAMGIGGMLMAAVGSLTMFSARSFVGIGHYIELDQNSRNALDQLSRAIRQTAGLKSCSSSSLSFTNLDGSEMKVAWSPSTRRLTQAQDGVVKTLLTECDSLRFNISQRNPSNGVFGFYPASDPKTAKLVDVTWRCSRTMLGRQYHTESVQTARIVIRN